MDGKRLKQTNEIRAFVTDGWTERWEEIETIDQLESLREEDED